MGCVSSKIVTRSGSFKEKVSHDLKGANGLEGLLTSKNGGDQFLALLCTANTVTRRLKAGPPTQESKDSMNASLELKDSATIDANELNNNTNPKVEVTNIETINTWELLDGLEENNEDGQQEKSRQQQITEAAITLGLPSTSFRMTEEYKFIVSNDSVPLESSNSSEEKPKGSVVRSRSIHTVEEYDVMVSRNNSLEGKYVSKGSESFSSIKECTSNSDHPSIKQCTTNSDHLDKVEGDGIEQEGKHVELEPESNATTASAKEILTFGSDHTKKKISRRKSMSKELTALKVPAFEFSKSGSLRDWLLQGGQVCSPGSYITPKFGDFVPPVAKDGERGCDAAVFDPEMVAQFEQAMKQLTMEEECVLKEIIESLESGGEEGVARISGTADDMQL